MNETNDADFLQTILSAPDDDTPRLVYADYLDEHGQEERAEFIRLQCELARTPNASPHQAIFKARAEELLAVHQVEWKNRLPILQGIHWQEFERGFVACVQIDDPQLFFTHAVEIFEATPVQHLRMHGVFMTEARRLAQIKDLRFIRELDLRDGNHIGNAGLEALAASPFLHHLRQLKIRNNAIALAGVRALAASPIANHLTLLDLDSNQIFDEAVQLLAESPRLQHLAILSLGWTRTSSRGAKALADSPFLSKLRMLYLTGNELGDDGAVALAQGQDRPRLESLYLENTRIGDDGAAGLASSAILDRVQYLYLKGNRIGDAGALALARSPYLQHVRELNLGENFMSDEGKDQLRRRFGSRVWLW